jgi:predicted phosphate transport protein (TIGR00153 family)
VSLRNFFGFLSNGERQILDRVCNLLESSIETSRHLLALAEYLKSYDYGAVRREYDTIADLEDRVTQEHRKLVREMCTGSFFGGIREDLLTLLELISNISFASKRAARVFHELQVPKDVVDYMFKDDVDLFISTCISAAETLRDGIKALEKNKNEVLSIVEKVEAKEREADTMKYAIIQNLFKNEINAKSLDIVMLQDFLETADDIADNSENGSDVLSILVAKGYS